MNTPHREAAVCRLSTALSEVCWNTCVDCHESTDPILPLDIYADGDLHICDRCHLEETLPVARNYLLNYSGSHGGNHPSAILYLPDGSRSELVREPVGPKLFTDEWGENPKVQCSTCHDPMSDSLNLLRVNNRGSALCRSCHRK